MIPFETKKDILWWSDFIEKYNGVSILWLTDTIQVDVQMATDASLLAAGAICDKEYLHVRFPQAIILEYNKIAHLELWAIIIAVLRWKDKIAGKMLRLSCDNEACVQIVNTGHCKDAKLLKCLRHLLMLLAENQTMIRLVYIKSKLNLLPDLLSRWYHPGTARRKFKAKTDRTWVRRSVTDDFFIIKEF